MVSEQHTGADQPVHPCSLISNFVIRFLKLATGEISILWLVSVAEETGLKLALWGNPEDRFCHEEALLQKLIIIHNYKPGDL